MAGCTPLPVFALATLVGAGVVNAGVVGAGVAVDRPFTVVGAGVTRPKAEPFAPAAAVAVPATAVLDELTTAVFELATTEDGTFTGTGIYCGTPTGTGIAIFVTFLTTFFICLV